MRRWILPATRGSLEVEPSPVKAPDENTTWLENWLYLSKTLSRDTAILCWPDSQILWDDKYVSFSATKFVAICYTVIKLIVSQADQEKNN